MGKVAVFAGMSLGTLFASTGCFHITQPLAGMPMEPDSIEVVEPDTIPERPLPGDVMMPEPTTPETEEQTEN